MYQPDRSAGLNTPDQVSGHRSIWLHGLPCEESNRNKITSGQCKQREGVQSQQSTESQDQCVKTLQHVHTYHEDLKKTQNILAKTETK